MLSFDIKELISLCCLSQWWPSLTSWFSTLLGPILWNQVSLILGLRINKPKLCCLQFCPYSYVILWHMGGTSLFHMTQHFITTTPKLYTGEWYSIHDDIIKWKHFLPYWSFVWGIHRSPVNSPHKGQWRRALMFSLICTWINGWVNNGKAGDLRCHRAHDDVTVMWWIKLIQFDKSEPGLM